MKKYFQLGLVFVISASFGALIAWQGGTNLGVTVILIGSLGSYFFGSFRKIIGIWKRFINRIFTNQTPEVREKYRNFAVVTAAALFSIPLLISSLVGLWLLPESFAGDLLILKLVLLFPFWLSFCFSGCNIFLALSLSGKILRKEIDDDDQKTISFFKSSRYYLESNPITFYLLILPQTAFQLIQPVLKYCCQHKGPS